MKLLSRFAQAALFAFSILLSTLSLGQVAIGTGANAPNPNVNAVLLLEGNGSQGIIIPKVNSLGNFGREGMIVYNTSTATVHYFGTSWVQIGSGGSQGIQIVGNKVLIGTGVGFSTEFSIANTAPAVNGQILMWDSSLNAGAGGWTSSGATAPSAVGQVLKWNGSRWEPGTDNTGSTTVADGSITGGTAGTGVKIAANTITDANINSLDAGKITSGTLPIARIAAGAVDNTKLATGIDAAKITTGTLPVAQVPNLDAAKITTGTLPISNGGTGATTAPAARTALGLGTLSTLNSVTGTEINDGTVAGVDLANNITINTTGNITAANFTGNGSGLTGITATVADGSITGGTAGAGVKLAANTITDANINSLDAGKITSGTLPIARIAAGAVDNTKLATGIDAAKITTGTLPVAQVPSLDAAKITTGTFTAAQIPNLDAAKITSGTLPIANGGTGATTAPAARTALGLGTLSTLNSVTGTEINDGTIADADISTSAAIAGSKINPAFGAQPVSTTSTLTTGSSGQFVINASGNITRINNITTSFPVNQGAANSVLTNDGAGNLTWGSSGWSLAGNPGTIPGTSFIGTTDTQPLDFRTNSLSRLTITSGGQIGLLNTSPVANIQLGDINSIGEFVGTNETPLAANTQVFITSKSNNGGFTPAAPEAALMLHRAGVNGASFSQLAGFSLSRYNNVDNGSYTQLDINLLGGVNTGSFPAVMSLRADGNVGIGNTSPTAKLDIIGNIKIVDGTQGAGKILTSDANGLASWQPAAGGGNMFTINNLSDLTNFATARTNLGLGSLATLSSVSSTEITDGTIAAADLATNIAINTTGNITAANFTGNGSGLTGITATVADGSITGGTAGAGVKLAANTITDANINSLDAGKITSGTLPTARIAAGAVDNTKLATGIDAAKVTTGTLPVAQVPNLDAAKITSGTLPITLGGTGATTAPAARTALGLGTLSTLSSVASADITDGVITDADISPSAAISGTKISGNFGFGNLSTAGTLSVSGGTSLTNTNLQIGALNYVWPAAHGSTGSVLTNNGSGTLTWSAGGSGWGLSGNPLGGAEKLGSTNGNPLTFITNGADRMTIDPAGNVGIGTTTPGAKLEVNGASGNAIVGSSNSSFGVYGQSFGAGAAVYGINNTGTAAGVIGITSGAQEGVRGVNNDAAGTGVYGLSTNGNAGRFDGKLVANGPIGLGGTPDFGTAGQVLTSGGVGGTPTWTTISGGGNMVSTNNLSDVANVATARTNLGLGSLATLSSVTSTEITDGTIAAADLATNIAINTTGNITAANFIGNGSGLTGITATVADGSITGGTAGAGVKLAANTITDANINSLDAGKITSGTLPIARIAAGAVDNTKLATGIDATKITTGTLPVAQVPNLDAAKITTGTFPPAQIPNLDASKITTGTFAAGQIPSLDASKITTGTLPVARGGTNLTSVTPGGVAYGGATDFAFTPVGISGQLLQSNGPGAPTWVNAPSTTTASNGLTKTGNDIALGGTLTGATTIANGGFNLIFSGAGNIGVGNPSPNAQFEVLKNSATANSALSAIANNGSGSAIFAQVAGVGTGPAININQNSSGFGLSSIVNNASNANPAVGGIHNGSGAVFNANATGTGRAANLSITNAASTATALSVSTSGVGPAASFSGGNVGIGTTTPTERLDVVGNLRFSGALMPGNLPGAVGQVLTSAGPGSAPTWGNGSGWGLTGNTLAGTERIGSDNLQPLAFETNNSERMRIDAAGNVGIGTTTPAVLLDINPATGVSSAIIKSNDNSAALTIDAAAGNFAALDFATNGTGRYGVGTFANDFYIDETGVDRRITVQSGSGFVGIGNIVPTEKLDVDGNLVISGNHLYSSTSNLWLGIASNNVVTGLGNLSFGGGSGITTGNYNMIFGNNAGFALTTGSSNITIGTNAGNAISTGSDNVAIGTSTNVNAGLSNSVALGSGAVATLSNAIVLGSSQNVGINTSAPVSKLDVNGDVRLAQITAPIPTTDKLYNVGGSLFWNGTNISSGGSGWGLSGNSTGLVDGAPGVGTNYIGTTVNVPLNFMVNNQRAGRIDQTLLSTFLGVASGRNNSGLNNTAVGYFALPENTSGASNTAVGTSSLNRITTGNQNTAVGVGSLFFNQTGGDNAAFGFEALSNSTSGSRNTGLGFQSLNVTTGQNNTAVGASAGFANTIGNNNTFLGSNADATVGTLTNATAIGYNAKVGANNSMALGGTGADAVNVGIGTATPAKALDILGQTAAQGPALRLSNSDYSHLLELYPGRTGDPNPFILVKGGDPLRFATDASGFTETMRIAANGNLGIGTPAPASKLTVGAGNAQLDLERSLLANDPLDVFSFQSKSVPQYSLGWYQDSETPGLANAWLSAFAGVRIFTGGVQRMRINDSGISIGTTSPAVNAALDIQSTTKGLLIPRLTTAQRDAIVSPELGLMVYNTSTSAFNFYNGGSWGPVGGAGSGWGLTGNAGTVDGTNFIGTTDAIPFTIRTANVRSARLEPATNGNSFFGFEAGLNVPNASTTTAVGYQTLRAAATGSQNTAIGYRAMNASNGAIQNVAVGMNALLANTTGSQNTASGYGALSSNTDGLRNVAVGMAALSANTSGDDNVSVGYQSILSNSLGNFNIGIGSQALQNTNANNNVGIGVGAGAFNTIGTNNTYLGNGANATVNNLTNATAVGAGAIVSQSNSVVLGNNSNVGIGTSSPVSSLHMDKAGSGNYVRFTEGGTLRGLIGISGGGTDLVAGDLDNQMAIRSESDLLLSIGATERMRISSAGNVGIGTSTAINRLDVQGSLAVGAAFAGSTVAPSNGALFDGNVAIGTSIQPSKLTVQGGNQYAQALISNNAFGTWQEISNTSTGGRVFGIISTGSSNSEGVGKLLFNANTSLGAGGTNVMTLVHSNSNVGIGTTSPVNRLDVEGGLAVGATYSGTSAAPTNGAIIEGNVGIGTSTPGALLDVNNAANGIRVNSWLSAGASVCGIGYVGTNLYRNNSDNVWKFTNTNGTIGGTAINFADCSGTPNQISFVRALGPSTANANATVVESMRIDQNGRVGIGTSSPGVPLDISGSVSLNDPSLTFFNDNNGGGLSVNENQTPNISVRATGGFLSTGSGFGGGFYVISDERIKRKVGISNSQNDLATLMKLKITDYKYVDSLNTGNVQVKGVFAQQVETIYPQAISKQTSFVPNIYAMADVAMFDEAKQTLRVTMTKPHHLAVGDKVKLISSTSGEKPSKVIAVNGNTFTVGDWTEKSEKIFVFGKEVNDFRIVDYDRLFTLNLSATQELVKMLDEQKKLIDELKAKEEESKKKIALLEASLSKVAAGETELTNLKSEIEKIKAALGLSVEATTKKATEKTETPKEK